MIAAPPRAAAAIVTVNTTDPRKRYPRSARVRLRAEYTAVFNDGRRISEPLFSLHWRAGDGPARLGMAVSRKVDTRAVARNRIKRVLRESMREILPTLAGGDYVVVARAGASRSSNAQLRDAFLRLLRRAGALPHPAPGGTMPRPSRADVPSISTPDSPSG